MWSPTTGFLSRVFGHAGFVDLLHRRNIDGTVQNATKPHSRTGLQRDSNFNNPISPLDPTKGTFLDIVFRKKQNNLF